MNIRDQHLIGYKDSEYYVGDINFLVTSRKDIASYRDGGGILIGNINCSEIEMILGSSSSVGVCLVLDPDENHKINGYLHLPTPNGGGHKLIAKPHQDYSGNSGVIIGDIRLPDWLLKRINENDGRVKFIKDFSSSKCLD